MNCSEVFFIIIKAYLKFLWLTLQTVSLDGTIAESVTNSFFLPTVQQEFMRQKQIFAFIFTSIMNLATENDKYTAAF